MIQFDVRMFFLLGLKNRQPSISHFSMHKKFPCAYEAAQFFCLASEDFENLSGVAGIRRSFCSTELWMTPCMRFFSFFGTIHVLQLENERTSQRNEFK